MHDYQEAMLKSLVAVAWADGRLDQTETEVLDAFLDAFGVEGDDADVIREYAKTPRSIDEVPLTDLSAHDRRMLIQHAVIVTWADGKQSSHEREMLAALVHRLRLPEDEAATLMEAAETRARSHFDLL